jgi:hypothetical protein
VRGDDGGKADLTVLCFEFMEPLIWRAPRCECRLVSVVRGLSVTPLRVTGTVERASVKWGKRGITLELHALMTALVQKKGKCGQT